MGVNEPVAPRRFYLFREALANYLGSSGMVARPLRFMKHDLYPGPLLVIDELGHLPRAAEAAPALFQVVNRRYLKNLIVITFTRPVCAWR